MTSLAVDKPTVTASRATTLLQSQTNSACPLPLRRNPRTAFTQGRQTLPRRTRTESSLLRARSSHHRGASYRHRPAARRLPRQVSMPTSERMMAARSRPAQHHLIPRAEWKCEWSGLMVIVPLLQVTVHCTHCDRCAEIYTS